MASETTLLSAQFYVVFEAIAHVLCVLFRLFRSTPVADDAFFFTDSAVFLMASKPRRRENCEYEVYGDSKVHQSLRMFAV
jgi:hypothetical protein